jgi:hypothetical protein
VAGGVADFTVAWRIPLSPERLGKLLQLWVPARRLRRDQHVRSGSSHAAFETTQPTALPSAGRGQLLRTDPALWSGAFIRLEAVHCLRKTAAIRFQESRMPGNLLVRFDEGRVGRTPVSPSLLLYRETAWAILATRTFPSLPEIGRFWVTQLALTVHVENKRPKAVCPPGFHRPHATLAWGGADHPGEWTTQRFPIAEADLKPHGRPPPGYLISLVAATQAQRDATRDWKMAAPPPAAHFQQPFAT